MREVTRKGKKAKRCFAGKQKTEIEVEIGAVQSSYSRPPAYILANGNYMLKQAWWMDRRKKKKIAVKMNWKMRVAQNSVLELGVVSIEPGKTGSLRPLVSPFPLGLTDKNPDWPEMKKAVIPGWLLHSQAPKLKLKRKYVDAYQEDINAFDANAWDRTEVIEYHMGAGRSRSQLGTAPSPPKYDFSRRVVKRAKPRRVQRVAPPPLARGLSYEIGVQYNVAVPRNRSYIVPLMSALDSESNALRRCYEANLKARSGLVRGTKWNTYQFRFRAANGSAVVASAGRAQANPKLTGCLQKVLQRAQLKRPPQKLTSGVMQVRFDYSGR